MNVLELRHSSTSMCSTLQVTFVAIVSGYSPRYIGWCRSCLTEYHQGCGIVLRFHLRFMRIRIQFQAKISRQIVVHIRNRIHVQYLMNYVSTITKVERIYLLLFILKIQGPRGAAMVSNHSKLFWKEENMSSWGGADGNKNFYCIRRQWSPPCLWLFVRFSMELVLGSFTEYDMLSSLLRLHKEIIQQRMRGIALYSIE